MTTENRLPAQYSAIWPSGAVPNATRTVSPEAAAQIHCMVGDYIQHAIDSGLARPAVPFRINQLENEVHCLRSAFQVERKRTAELEAENNDLRDMIALLRMQMKAAAPVATPDAKPFPLRALSDRKPRLGLVVSRD